mmetsp:Transcript_28971/g.32491  ORF Transcript_28971/g.32491 Transcript_28971/m.32491 type:complete len:367 (+) Transcript_28971:69-1169(+)|eukprot:CAMPEP_0170762294 /NCGR_PEP_ID=MMETSP0733-20121128/2675_1 /TAXON_ID=186038 /ORGANISM="Fragilariopsis kerguelensis, Strain L26-C5" /LENGTH=366 /DNA_ID=CAMNT_0011102429 /DNA_START=9 /DNA_END=1109 /DNA_ORIENTATION=-
MPEKRRSMSLRASKQQQQGPHSPQPSRTRSAERCSSICGSSSSSRNPTANIALSDSNHSDSNSAVSEKNNIISSVHYRRSNSDPFDDAGDELMRIFETANHAEKVQALPTLHRFPCTQTRNQNCWSESPIELFSVRGPNYMSGDKIKIPCKNYLLRSRGCDLFLTEDNNSMLDIKRLQGGLGGNLRKKPTFLFRFLFPWGMLIQYYEVPPKLVPFMKWGDDDDKQRRSTKGFTNAERVLAKWFASEDPEYKNDRLKLIAIVQEGPWIVRNLVTGKPALIGKRLPVTYKYVSSNKSMACLQICDLNVASGSAVAKKTVNVTRRYMSSLTAIDIGFVIEGKTPEELPEEMLGSTRLHQVDPTEAPTVY